MGASSRCWLTGRSNDWVAEFEVDLAQSRALASQFSSYAASAVWFEPLEFKLQLVPPEQLKLELQRAICKRRPVIILDGNFRGSDFIGA